MDKVLSIDFGHAKVGIAISSGTFAEPLSVIRFENLDELFVKIKRVCGEQKPSLIIVGVSAGKMANDSQDFGKKLGDYLGIPVRFVDESFSTKEVQTLALEAGIKRKKRKNMEDAYAAALILQNYLDSDQSMV